MPNDNLPSAAGKPREVERPAYSAEPEISLFDIWEFLVRRAVLICSVWALVLVLAGAYLLLAPRVYESRAVLKLAQVAGEPVIGAEQLELMLYERYRLNDDRRSFPRLEEVEGRDGFVIFNARAAEPGQAQEYLAELVADVAKELNRLYRQGRQVLEDQLSGVLRDIEAMETEAAALDPRRIDGNKGLLPAMLAMQRSEIRSNLLELGVLKAELRRQLAAPQSVAAGAAREAEANDEPVLPAVVLVLALAFAAGGVLGLLVAFVAELRAYGRHHRLET